MNITLSGLTSSFFGLDSSAISLVKINEIKQEFSKEWGIAYHETLNTKNDLSAKDVEIIWEKLAPKLGLSSSDPIPDNMDILVTAYAFFIKEQATKIYESVLQTTTLQQEAQARKITFQAFDAALKMLTAIQQSAATHNKLFILFSQWLDQYTSLMRNIPFYQTQKQILTPVNEKFSETSFGYAGYFKDIASYMLTQAEGLTVTPNDTIQYRYSYYFPGSWWQTTTASSTQGSPEFICDKTAGSLLYVPEPPFFFKITKRYPPNSTEATYSLSLEGFVFPDREIDAPVIASTQTIFSTTLPGITKDTNLATYLQHDDLLQKLLNEFNEKWFDASHQNSASINTLQGVVDRGASYDPPAHRYYYHFYTASLADFKRDYMKFVYVVSGDPQAYQNNSIVSASDDPNMRKQLEEMAKTSALRFRAEKNMQYQLYLDQFRSKKQLISDRMDSATALMDQIKQAIQNQTGLLSTIVEHLKATLQAIFH